MPAQIRTRQCLLTFFLLFLIGPLTGCSFSDSAPQPNLEATIQAGIVATQQAQSALQATIDAAVIATQQAGQTTSDTIASDQATPAAATPLAVSTIVPPLLPEDAVRAVILDEIYSAIEGDIPRLQSLYAPGAVVIDRNWTPDNPEDDTIWQGWPNIERRYSAFLSSGFSSGTLTNLSVTVNGNQAIGTHDGAVLDGQLVEDKGVYTLELINGQWLITQLEYGNMVREDPPPVSVPTRNDGLYVLQLGSQHRYEEPWGWDRGDPCTAWQTGNWDDTKPDYRGFNVELLLTNNSDRRVPDSWPISFTTAKGKAVKACFYGYEGSGPAPGATTSVTFFTVVEKGDYVKTVTFSLNDQVLNLCLDGQGGAGPC